MYNEVVALSTLIYEKNLLGLVSHLRLLYCQRAPNQRVVASNQAVSCRSNSFHSGSQHLIMNHTLNSNKLLQRSLLTLKVLKSSPQKVR